MTREIALGRDAHEIFSNPRAHTISVARGSCDVYFILMFPA
jgi:hypothetical protein